MFALVKAASEEKACDCSDSHDEGQDHAKHGYSAPYLS